MIYQVTSCPVCANAMVRSSRITVNTTKRFTIVRCSSCGLAYATPRPTVDELAVFYSATYFNRPEGATIGYEDYEQGSWATNNAARMWEAIRLWAPALERIEPRVALDVGCATGVFAASLAEEGWEVRGVELAESARALAVHRGVDAVATIDEVAGGIGLATMFHVLEHVLDPVASLAAVRDRIEPRGRLVIELPQWHSLGRIIKKGGWSAMTPPEHINFFDVKSLPFALSRSGWAVEQASTVHPRGADRAVWAIKQRRFGTAVKNIALTAAIERAGLAGYLRVLAKPV